MAEELRTTVGGMTPVTLDQLLSRFDESVHDKILAQAARSDVTHIVVFENLDLCPSRLGDRTALAVGPGCTTTTVEEAAGRWLHDLPSMRQYPVAYANVEDYHGEETK